MRSSGKTMYHYSKYGLSMRSENGILKLKLDAEPVMTGVKGRLFLKGNVLEKLYLIDKPDLYFGKYVEDIKNSKDEVVKSKSTYGIVCKMPTDTIKKFSNEFLEHLSLSGKKIDYRQTDNFSKLSEEHDFFTVFAFETVPSRINSKVLLGPYMESMHQDCINSTKKFFEVVKAHMSSRAKV